MAWWGWLIIGLSGLFVLYVLTGLALVALGYAGFRKISRDFGKDL